MKPPHRLTRSSDPSVVRDGVQLVWALYGYGIRWAGVHHSPGKTRKRKATRESMVLRGLCRDCGLPNTDYHIRCWTCREKHGLLRKTRKMAGVCTDCGGPKDNDTKVCRQCWDRRRSHYRTQNKPNPVRICPDCKTTECQPRKHSCLCCWTKRRAKSLKNKRELNKSYKIQVLGAYGNKCAHCGENREKLLQIDHVNDDGNKEPRTPSGKRRSGAVFYRRILKEGCPPRYQILCIACNARKYAEALSSGKYS